MSRSNTQEKRIRIKRKIRASIVGSATRPRLSVFRSNNYVYVQLIDDANGKTLVSASDLKAKKGTTKMQGAIAVGSDVAARAKEQGISEVVFDRNGFKYAGRIKALADAAREAGLKF